MSFETIRKGVRRGNIKYLCKKCGRHFQVNKVKRLGSRDLLVDHLEGYSFRSLSQKYNISVGSAYGKCFEALKKLPHCADVTRMYCSKFSGVLLVDGKFVNVKGFERKIPIIYGIDYQTHDIPTFVFSIAENFMSLIKFFSSLRLLNYPLRYLVSDDNLNIPEACREIYPKAFWQLCTNHFKENIRRTLGVRTEPLHQPFMNGIEDLFSFKRSEDDFNRVAKNIFNVNKNNDLYVSILLDIEKRKKNLLGYKDVPRTTNLIESFNSQFQAKFRLIKTFESFKHADLWSNGYILRRRFRVFTDCTGKFKSLNGKSSIEISKKPDVDLPTFF